MFPFSPLRPPCYKRQQIFNNDFITEQHFQFCLYSQYTSTHYNLQLSHIQLITINVIIVQIKTYFTTIKQSCNLTPLKKTEQIYCLSHRLVTFTIKRHFCVIFNQKKSMWSHKTYLSLTINLLTCDYSAVTAQKKGRTMKRKKS